ncbi:MAG: isopentenyl-diphosphate Delta-isomerase [Alphaproteobacteria bacterium]|nr:isopentenyl-diphosphate Delta-isomerase [Alphaproteobacteria bacterium]
MPDGAAPPHTILPATDEQVILVSPSGRKTGYGEKHEVHRLGLRHRAFSVFLFDHQGRTLLQRRHPGKYHSGGLWANSCCGHPRPKEPIRRAARRRVHEELGVWADLTPAFTTAYFVDFGNGMTENEVVTVFTGRLTQDLALNPIEVTETVYSSLPNLRDDWRSTPERYAYWLQHYLRNHFPALKQVGEALS